MKALIYSKQLCNYCVKAKALLEERGVSFELVDCTFSTELTKEMMNRSGQKTFPQIFLDGVHIGGCDDLVALDQSGGLIAG
ncbi:putative glutaredoxin [Rhizobium phage vB_RleS_L338C]|uniref:putative glutaredoxin n=1 Tax=Rhizobium phage vB_RleS_L338C TaxID=1414737 RepID=UPI0003D8D4F3|nr:putative glutaredoxin [Rhizobium phage vB_RleS_L338C]AHC30425.1 putative glutaredoxin [Rhizobium phage vB_RleS_L338C]QNH72164.1 hypothetical protein P11VFA_129 [Rhizobium phage P11VFA]